MLDKYSKLLSEQAGFPVDVAYLLDKYGEDDPNFEMSSEHFLRLAELERREAYSGLPSEPLSDEELEAMSREWQNRESKGRETKKPTP